ncbi:MAG: metal-dependent transcriptional regulator [Eubacteriaceae bacterium]|nr:metal-dependent transcriptional regulator [Eubacteriaceae bacterium]
MEKTYESAENYMETILILNKKQSEVRSIDIVHETGFSKPSVSVAMKHLKEKGLIDIDDSGYITLTAEGMTAASAVYERHLTLSEALKAIGVSEETAVADACRIEHYISQESFDKIKEYVENKIR